MTIITLLLWLLVIFFYAFVFALFVCTYGGPQFYTPMNPIKLAKMKRYEKKSLFVSILFGLTVTVAVFFAL
jgi:hypothetical protein